MRNRTEMDFNGEPSVRSRGGWGFAAGVLVGLTGAIAGLTLAVAAQRRARRQTLADSSSTLSGSESEPEEWQTKENELDEELAQTFPASDPLPQSHRVD
ncbi:MAG TPA: hypothetical protein VMF64_07975 [Steroidobacteraceae bacterium]|nr:hypothetical protein [Steroidobacteraceae bacterium]